MIHAYCLLEIPAASDADALQVGLEAVAHLASGEGECNPGAESCSLVRMGAYRVVVLDLAVQLVMVDNAVVRELLAEHHWDPLEESVATFFPALSAPADSQITH